ncbi:MAG: hypothetical protein PHT32_02905 [Candidatus Omnitrophica bacterium]|nr:hypothetical protein [Candidatus Omnitrophota bacterium]
MKIIACIAVCLLLSSCASVDEIRNSDAVSALGSFQLNPVEPNNYWYNGKSYEYNGYEIRVTAGPGEARIKWDGKLIGTTPFVYRFTGILDKDDYVKIRAIPIDEKFPPQEAVLRIRTELPRKIHFDLQKQR